MALKVLILGFVTLVALYGGLAALTMLAFEPPLIIVSSILVLGLLAGLAFRRYWPGPGSSLLYSRFEMDGSNLVLYDAQDQPVKRIAASAGYDSKPGFHEGVPVTELSIRDSRETFYIASGPETDLDQARQMAVEVFGD